MWVDIYLDHQIACQFVGSKKKKKKTREQAGKKRKQEGTNEQLFGESLEDHLYGHLVSLNIKN